MLVLLIIICSFIFPSQPALPFLTDNTPTLCLQQERNALLKFSSAFTNNDETFIDDNWIQGTDCCQWEGVTCNPSTGHVTAILLGLGNNLMGSLPPHLNSSSLPRLYSLDLSWNTLTGTIPGWLFEFQRLAHLDLSGNTFTDFGNFSVVDLPTHRPMKTFHADYNNLHGSVPDFIFQLQNLQSLQLGSNFLTGTIPLTKLPYLTSFSISGTSLSLIYNTTSSSVAGFVQNYPQLTDLSLANCNLKKFPTSILRAQKSIKNLDLSYNDIHGELPDMMYELKSLETLNLDANKLSGPFHVTQFQNLTTLSLSGNDLTLVDTATEFASLLRPQFTHVSLSSCKLDEFPSILKGQLSIQHLNLSSNRLRGNVPDWFLELGRHTLSTLDLSNNALTGGLTRLPWLNLQKLYLSSNLFESPIPTIPPNVETFFASNNRFRGEIPSWICDVVWLQYLDLSFNQLSGNISNCLVKLSSNNHIQYLNLRHNLLNDSISPLAFEKCMWLDFLDLNGNQLSGPIPRTLSRCVYLELLDLGNNQIDDTFPEWLGNNAFSMLQVLILHSNQIHGSLPVKYSPPTLRILDISNNKLNGSLANSFLSSLNGMIHKLDPREVHSYSSEFSMDPILAAVKGALRFLVGKDLHSTVILDLSCNQFQGSIPDIIGDLAYLRLLNLSHNDFTGQIPSSLGKLSLLESLDLNSNSLDGKIPGKLGKLTFLAVFNVSYNKLVGSVPETSQFSSFGNESYLGNPGICGDYLAKKCGEAGATTLPMGQDGDVDSSDHLGWLKWEIISIGFVCGIVCGLIGGYFLFLETTSPWLVTFAFWLKALFITDNGKRKNGRTRRN